MKALKEIIIIAAFIPFCHFPAMSRQTLAEREELKYCIPQPVYEADSSLVKLYYQAWEYAKDHIMYTPGLASPCYMDEGCRDGNGPQTIWIWDTEFMAMYCKYAPKHFPGIESLKNFYTPLLDSKESPLRIHHPDNPPLFAWIEYEYYKFTGDKAHLDSLIKVNAYPQRYFDFFNTLDNSRKFSFGYQKVLLKNHGIGFEWGPNQCGMDNTARHREGDIYWLDAISQQALSALYITKLAKEVGDRKTLRRFKKEYASLRETIDKYYWDDSKGCYFDIFRKDSTTTGILSVASFWPLLAEIPSPAKAERMVRYALDSLRLGGRYPWKSLDPANRYYVADGGKYWRGAIWLPTAYMGIKALEKNGFSDEASASAERLLIQMRDTWRDFEPHTIWECYSPSAALPALNKKNRLVREDFCGWSALGPISLFIENVIGIYDVDAVKRIVKWDIRHNFTHGVKHLRFGTIDADLIYSEGAVRVRSNASFVLIANGRRFRVRPGENRLLCP